MKSKDVIDRQYLQNKLRRDKATHMLPSVCAYISSLQEWVRDSTKRTKRPGGLGK